MKDSKPAYVEPHTLFSLALSASIDEVCEEAAGGLLGGSTAATGALTFSLAGMALFDSIACKNSRIEQQRIRGCRVEAAAAD